MEDLFHFGAAQGATLARADRAHRLDTTTFVKHTGRPFGTNPLTLPAEHSANEQRLACFLVISLPRDSF